MKARDIMGPVPEVRTDEPIKRLLAAFERPEVRAVAVVTEVGELVGVINDQDLLGALLPSYVLDDESLAGVLDEAAAATLQERLRAKRCGDLLDESKRHHTIVLPDDTLLEVATALAKTKVPAVVVVDQGQVLGAITIDQLLGALLNPRGI